MQRHRRGSGASGFTLLEVLVSLVVLALIGVAITAMSLTGFTSIGDGAQERQQDATTAQWTAIRFARDVQGASSLVDECSPGAGTHLFTVRASDSTERIEYRWQEPTPGSYQLTRTECDAAGSARRVVGDLQVQPTVTCEGDDGSVVPCAPGTAPRRITLQVSRTSSFGFELDGARRLLGEDRDDPPLEVPTFVALGGDTPFEAGGNSQLQVLGNALINRPDTNPPVAVDLYGGGCGSDPAACRLVVTGDFELQEGATCPNCPTHSATQPGTFRTRLLDPLRFLPAPDTTSMPTRTNCPVESGVRVCQPGVYPDEFPPALGGGGVRDFELRPGIYVLRGGLRVNNGSVVGSDVMIYNETGQVRITGADIDLSPPSSGVYSGILFFQARGNTSEFRIVGNAQLASVVGTIYAPSSVNVVLGGGNGEMRVGRVIGQNLEISGGGKVIVDGS